MSNLWQHFELASELDLQGTVNWGREWLVDSFDQSNNTGAIDEKIDGSVLEKKSTLKMLGMTFSSKLDWCCYIISIAKMASKKIGTLMRSVIFFLQRLLCLCKSTIRPCREYCCHVWAGTPSCFLELLDKLQKRICRTVVPSLVASLKPWLIVEM